MLAVKFDLQQEARNYITSILRSTTHHYDYWLEPDLQDVDGS